jgi:type IV pilus biogenesis protein CpaD/CtpE
MISDLSPWLQESAHSIDAAIFSGDEFLDKNKRENMEKLLNRWKKGLDEMASLASIIEEEEKNELI